MDTQQLKLMAGRLRGALEQRGITVTHSQALDLMAALPGLRNWPEVIAFPGRVGACSLEPATAARLAHRIRSRHGLDWNAQSIQTALNPPSTDEVGAAAIPQVWPGGPAPGVYVTTSQSAISALLHLYEEATDGDLVYAEAAASDWHGSIYLGENGLWSQGLDRVPSGTLVVVGPLLLTQQDWSSSSDRLEIACLHALNAGLRVAILVDTPTPDLLHMDLTLMMLARPNGEDRVLALQGSVAQDGRLLQICPFVPTSAYRSKQDFGSSGGGKTRDQAELASLPPSAIPLLSAAVERRPTGLLGLGSNIVQTHRAIDQVAAAVVLTNHLGPAARIKQRVRGTPGKDDMVPDVLKALPVLPSIESAHAHGFKRMLIGPYYTEAETLLEYAEEVLFISACHGSTAENVFTGVCSLSGGADETALLAITVAMLGVAQIEGKTSTISVPDLFIPGDAVVTVADIRANRSLRWEDGLAHVLESKAATLPKLKDAYRRDHEASEFLASYRSRRSATRTQQEKGIG
ncbi:glyoxalase superfamily protein [Sphaerotilus montanus]|uniref:glyoxalase superfamily protein n=1 Tax=Sphaerotilus montanus TaxID=522889 RepID=UPI003FA33AD3